MQLIRKNPEMHLNTIFTYYSMKNNFANVTNAGGSASFQFSNYEDAKAAYDTLLAAYEANGGTVPNSAMSGL